MLFACALISTSRAATISAALDPTFAVGYGAGNPLTVAQYSDLGQIQAVAVQPDGKVLAGGQGLFTNFNGTAIKYFCRINADGSLDTAFQANLGAGFSSAGAAADINDILVLTNGQILIAGDFTTVNGVSRVGVARLNADGTLDTGFLPAGGGVGGSSLRYGKDVSLQADGKILLGGGFTSYLGTARPSVVRLNTDGSLDTSFNPAFGTGFGVNSVEAQSDGKIYVGGTFTNWAGVKTPGIVRLNTDGSLDGSFLPRHTCAFPQVQALLPDGSGGVYIGGFIESAQTNGVDYTTRYFARLTSSGTIDTSYPAGGGPNGWVSDIVPWPEGGILVSGRFNGAGGQPRGELAYIDANGNVDPGFAPPPVLPSFEDLVHIYTIGVGLDGKIVVGGWFTNYPNGTLLNGQNYSGIARIVGGYGVGPGRLQFTSGYFVDEGAGMATVSVSRFGGSIGAVSVAYATASGTATSGSDFTAVSGTLSWTNGESGIKTFTIPVNSDAAPEGLEAILVGLSSPTGGATLGTLSSSIVTIVDDDSPPIILAPPVSQSVYLGFPVFFAVSVGPGPSVTFQWYSNNVAITGATNGYFGLVNVQTNFAASYSVRVTNAKGFTDSLGAALTVTIPAGLPEPSFITPGSGGTLGFNGDAYSLAFQANGQLLVGGAFSQYGGASVKSFLARLALDGTRDSSFPSPTSGPGGTVKHVGRYPDGRILIAGDFNSYAGVLRSGIARLTPDGALDTSFTNNLIVNVYSAASILPDGGALISDQSVPPRLFRLSNSGAVDTNFFQAILPGSVSALAPTPDGKILAASYRSSFPAGTEIFRLNANGTLDLSFTGPGRFMNTQVQNLLLMPDGRIVVAGGFSAYRTETATNSAPRIVLLNPNGSVDASFNVGSGPSDSIISALVQPDGRIVLGGAFTTWNGQPASRLMRLLPDGQIDPTFIIGTGASGFIRALAMDSLGRLAIGGTFTTVNGQQRGRVALLTAGEGSVQFTNSVQRVNENTVSLNVAVERVAGSRGAVSVSYTVTPGTATGGGTDYSASNGTLNWADGEAGVKTFSVTLNNDGAIEPDETFSVGLSGVTGGAATGLRTNLVVEILDDESAPRFAQQPAGATAAEDTSFTFTSLGYGALPFTYQWRSNGVNILNATNPSLTLVNVQSNTAAVYSVRLTSTAGGTNSVDAVLSIIPSPVRRDTTFAPAVAFNGNVRTVWPMGDGRALVGGDFTLPRSKLVLVQSNGTTDLTFTNLPGGSGTVGVYDISRDSRGRWLIAGQFTTFNGLAISNLVRLNADYTVDTNFSAGLNIGPNGLVRDVVVGPDGKIWIGGDLTSVGGPFGLQYGARLNDDGSVDRGFLPRANGPIYRIIPLSGGGALLGGTFSSYAGSGGSPKRVFADGSPDSSYNPSFSGSVYDMILQPDGTLYAAGQQNGSTTRLLKFFPSGAADNRFLLGATNNESINSIAFQPNGRLVAVGPFTALGGSPTVHSNRFARINTDGTVDPSVNIGAGFSAETYRVATEANGQIWVGGSFTTYKGLSAPYLVRLVGDMGDVNLAEIGLQPYDQVVAPGSNVVFTASGSGVDYQWFKDGVELTNSARISGATSQILTLIGVSAADAGGYFLSVATINANAFYSRVAQLSVKGLPNFLAQPVGGIVPLGGRIAIGAQVEGAPSLAFRWLKDGSPVAGNGSSFVLNGATAGNSGAYTLVASNAFGSTTSLVANVTVQATPASAAPGFFSDAGWNNSFGEVFNALQPLPDGRLFAGGSFTQLKTNGATATFRQYLGLFATNGTLASFDAGFSSAIADVVRQTDGKTLVGGSFTTISNGLVNRKYLVRFNADLTLDTGFTNGIGTGPDNSVSDIALQPNGKILIAGSFTTVNGKAGTRAVARLNADGSVDDSFVSQAANFTSGSLVDLLPDGRILLVVGGQYGGHSASLYRLASSGVVDTTFTNSLSSITALLVQNNNSILVGGTFATVYGTARPMLARLADNGRLDPTFLSGSTNGTGYNQPRITTLALQDNGKILAGGNFLSFGPFVNGLARFNADGTPDTSFLFQQGIGDGLNAFIYRITSFADGRIAVGGNFTTWEGVAENGLVILNGDTVPLAFSVHPVSQFVPSGTTVQFAAQTVGTSPVTYRWYRGATPLTDGGNIAGATTSNLTVTGATLSDTNFYSVIATNLTGGTRTSLPAELFILSQPVFREQPVGGISFVSNSFILRATVLGLGNIGYRWLMNSNVLTGATNASLVYTNLSLTNSGFFQLVASNSLGVVTSSVAQLIVLPPPATLSTTWPHPAGAGGRINSIVPLGDGRVVIGGSFSAVGPAGNSTSRANLALLETNGTANTTFNPAPDGQVNVVVRDGVGGFLVGGSFFNIGGQSRGNFARLNSDGSLDATFLANLGSGPNQIVYDIGVQADGKILLGGSFSTVSGQSYPTIVRLNSTGTIDASFRLTQQFAQQIQTLAVRADGLIYVGGSLTVSNRQNIIRLNPNGSVDLSFTANTDYSVNKLTALADGGMVVGGFFSTVNGAAAPNFARLSASGGIVPGWPLATPNQQVQSMVLQPNGRLVIAGAFATVGAQRAQIARYETDGSLDTSFVPGTGFGGSGPSALALEADGRIWVGGSFTTYSGTAVNRLVLLAGDPSWLGMSGGSPFDNWAASSGLTAGNNQPEQDADLDGIPNVFEYYFGSLPLNGASGFEPFSTSVTVSAQSYPAMSFIRSKTAAGVTPSIRVSSSVLFADSLGSTEHSVADLGNGTELVVIRSNVSSASQPNQFLQLRLSIP